MVHSQVNLGLRLDRELPVQRQTMHYSLQISDMVTRAGCSRQISEDMWTSGMDGLSRWWTPWHTAAMT